jgi:hypothetical protein
VKQILRLRVARVGRYAAAAASAAFTTAAAFAALATATTFAAASPRTVAGCAGVARGVIVIAAANSS